MRLRVFRVQPLGEDRDFKKYWYFDEHGSAFGFFGSGKIFVSTPKWEWSYYSTVEQIDQLVEHLNPKGERELALRTALKENYVQIVNSIRRVESVCPLLPLRLPSPLSQYSLFLLISLQDLTLMLKQEESRRSERIRTTVKKQSYVGYTNKWAS